MKRIYDTATGALALASFLPVVATAIAIRVLDRHVGRRLPVPDDLS